MVRILFFMILCLLAARAFAQGTMVSPHTGLAGGYSSEIRVSDHRHFTVYAQANVIRGPRGIGYTVMLRHGAGDGSPIWVDSAFSHGRTLYWDALPRDQVCSMRHCLWNLGVLAFSGAEFQRLSQVGISMRLITSEGPIDVSIPARLFQEASQEAAAVL